MRCMKYTKATTMVLMKTIIVLLLLMQDAMGQDYVWCYECGTGVPGQPDCLVFALSSSWRMFGRKCTGDSVCVKTMSGWDINNELKAVRGCTPKVSLARTTHQDGCWTHTTSSTITCYCSSNLCNGSPTLSNFKQYSIMVISSLLLYIIYRS